MGAAGLSHVFLFILFGTMVLIASLPAERQRLNRKVDLNANAYQFIAENSGDIIVVEGDDGIISMTRDVSERKLKERRLEDLNAELETMAGTDVLTGIANRRRFNEVRRLEWQRAWRQKQPLALLIADIDNLKLFNDSYGHAAGDQCIARIATAIKAVLRRPAEGRTRGAACPG